MAIQPDGKLVVAGVLGGQLAVVRYLLAGALDPTFDADGVALRPGPGFATSLVLQPDGKILVAGGTGSSFLLSRFTPTGDLDSSFGTGGSVETALGGSVVWGVALPGDGKIVVAGTAGCAPTCQDFAVARYNTNGSLDAGFGAGGTVVTDLGGSEVAMALALQPDGKLVVGGGGSTNDFTLVRYNADGSLDQSFGAGGVVISTAGDAVNAIAIRPDGRIVVAGTSFEGPSQGNFAVVLLLAEGGVDRSFSQDGSILHDLAGPHDFLDGIALGADGKIVAVGFSGTLATGAACQCDFAVVRYLAGGAPQPPAPPLVIPPPATPPVPPPPPAQPLTPAAKPCVVPNVKGKRLTVARSALVRARCRIGTVTRRYSSRVGANRVLSQRPAAGRRLAARARVNLVLSRGPRR